MYEKTTLANGLRILTNRMPHTHSAAVQFYVGVGARNEQIEKSGISHFLEHMVFKGTSKRPRPVQISEAIEGVGGALDAATDHEHTNYRALVPSPHLAAAVDVLSDMLRRPLLLKEEVARERDVIIEEISSTYDSPSEIVDFLFDELLWGNHPLGRDVAGSKQTVRRIRSQDLETHLLQGYTPDRIVVSVAGNVTHKRVVRELERQWGDLAPAAAGAHLPAAPAPPPDETGPRTLPYRKRTEQTNLILGVPALSYTHPQRYTQDVLDAILGSGMSSRLFVEIRENRGLAYAVSSFTRTYQDTGAFGVYAAVDNEKVPSALQGILAEMERIKREPVPDTELRKVKEYIKGHTLLGLERSGYVAHWGGWQELMLGRIQGVDEVLEQVEAVTSEGVAALANELFREERLHLALVSPMKNALSLTDHLHLH